MFCIFEDEFQFYVFVDCYFLFLFLGFQNGLRLDLKTLKMNLVQETLQILFSAHGQIFVRKVDRIKACRFLSFICIFSPSYLDNIIKISFHFMYIFSLGLFFPFIVSNSLSKSLTHLSSETFIEYVVKIRNSRGWFHNKKQFIFMVSTTLMFFIGISLFFLIEAQLFGRKVFSWQFYILLISSWKFLFLWKFVGFIYEFLFIYFLGKQDRTFLKVKLYS